MTSRPNADRTTDGVCVFAPSTIVTVTVEDSSGDDEVHFHAGGQGFWIARLLGRLGVPTTLCSPFGGESGRVALALARDEPIEVRAIEHAGANGVWVHDRRSGERVAVADDPGPPLGRHATDELVSAALAVGLDLGICVLAGPHRSGLLDPSHYERLASDLRANDVTVIADLSEDPLRAALTGGVDFCKASDEDLIRTREVASLGPREALDWLRQAGAVRAALTRGVEPVIVDLDGQVTEIRTPELRAVDHRGAGDAFTALVAATRYWGLDWDDAVLWAAAAGALTVTRRGLATADRQEIHHLLAHVTAHPVGDDRG